MSDYYIIENYNGVTVKIDSNDELIQELIRKNLKMLNMWRRFDGKYAVMTYDSCCSTDIMSSVDYANFNLIFETSNTKIHIAGLGFLQDSDVEETDTSITYHFEFDERGDKRRIYDSYKICDMTPEWMICRAIRQHDNKFIRWLISSYPDDVKDLQFICFIEAIVADNAEAFHLFEECCGQLLCPKDYIKYAEKFNRPEYAEYIRNHYGG